MLHPINWQLALPYYAAALAFGYLLGAIPFGLVLTKLAGTQDIRTIGSKNIGATNVLRTGRKGLAAATLLCDILKGTAAVLIAYRFYGQDLAILAGLGAFLGHLFPAWPAALTFAAIWLLVAAVTRYSSLSALIASFCMPVVLWLLDHRQEAQLFLLLTLLVWIMHRANIARLWSGTEGRIGQKTSEP
jgi:glycerol-3-phosphate acyltransferase PlsY